MISECGSEVEHLAEEVEESREKSSQLEGKLKVIEDAHSLEAARFESRIGELERDLGKTAKATKSSELRWLKRKTRLARIADSLDSLAAIHVGDLALADVEGGMNEVGEAHISPQAEEATLPFHRVELVDAEGEFDLFVVGLKSKCILLSRSGEPEGQDLVAEDGGGSAAPIPEGAIGEGEAPRADDD
ncbi:hypothetical protein F2Q69_00006278 [Brassica cretica]|uniref:Uncharacterized protein n=1 Tax=Brassica cretica TaxID=69181 RepID=A0A8S9P7E1_BRACR|nr:hypothetical protein F2Q69_00006278 [Brassica cretica]